MLSLEEARKREVCRYCEQSTKSRIEHDYILLKFGKEYAHSSCASNYPRFWRLRERQTLYATRIDKLWRDPIRTNILLGKVQRIQRILNRLDKRK